MHKRLLNQCLIDLEIRTEGPLLIKSGSPGFEGPDMAPVFTFRDRSKAEPYIPGSSLKGVIRSHAERIARTLCWDPDDFRVGACNPFLTDKKARDWTKPDGYCGAKFQQRKDKKEDLASSTVYRDSCPACKVFGNTFLIGRLSVPDAYLLPEVHPRTERRDGVGIDRFTGGAAHRAKFDLEAVTNAKFRVRLQLVNFELWQLGLLAFVLRDLKEGLIGIGSGKSRGLGQVSAIIGYVDVAMASHSLPNRDGQRLWGLMALETDENRRAYGYWQREGDGVLLDDAQSVEDPLDLQTSYRLSGENAALSLWRNAARLASSFLDDYQIPADMQFRENGHQR
ncbi:MAG TPA: CRISPR-associated RAMP protein Csx7 [Blastocatellia bacterium]|nr:CRISPR-associated RAMP protein Csx7 [Blastocatellia bacterium]